MMMSVTSDWGMRVILGRQFNKAFATEIYKLHSGIADARTYILNCYELMAIGSAFVCLCFCVCVCVCLCAYAGQ